VPDGSGLQVLEQQLGKIPLSSASSHVSVPTSCPSPQMGAHMDGSPEQLQPSSTVHEGEQPSSASRLASSQPSPVTMRPSPQM